MYFYFIPKIFPTCNLSLSKFSNQSIVLHRSLFIRKTLRLSGKFNLFSLFFLLLSLSFLLLSSYPSLALTSETTNTIRGNAPYLTFDGGRTQATNTDELLGITLSNGDKYSPSENPSSETNPIELPVADQSVADIGMFLPTDTDSIELGTLIATTNTYWVDPDGDGNVNVTGNLNLSIVDKDDKTVTRNDILKVCKAPYKVILEADGGTLSTSYGVPNSSSFDPSSATYYISPKVMPIPSVCFIKPSLKHGDAHYKGPASMWDEDNGYLVQSIDSATYEKNFPTTASNNLSFDLMLAGIEEPLNWATVNLSGIKATMTNSTNKSVHVTLTGPVAKPEQWVSDDPGTIYKPVLPQTFELVGKDARGNVKIKYGFQLKQWFVNRGPDGFGYDNTLSWCNKIGYRLPQIKDLTNAACHGLESGTFCTGGVGTTPISPNNEYQRIIGAGFYSEWGFMKNYSGANFDYPYGYWVTDAYNFERQFVIRAHNGTIGNDKAIHENGKGVCAAR